MPKQLDEELSVLMPVNLSSAATDFSVTPPPYNAEGVSTETWPMLAPYKDSDIPMLDVNDSVTDNLYK